MYDTIDVSLPYVRVGEVSGKVSVCGIVAGQTKNGEGYQEYLKSRKGKIEILVDCVGAGGQWVGCE